VTGTRTHVALYRRMTRLYPPAFRADYGADLVRLFAQQIEEQPPAHVWGRTFRDLLVSVPTQRLEAHMNRPATHLLPVVSGVVAGVAALIAVAVGTGPALPIFIVLALLGAAITVWSWQASQPVRADNAAGASWWKVLLAGPALAALTFAAIAIPWPQAIDLGENAYWLIVIAFMTSMALAAAGLLLGISAAVGRRRSPHTGPTPA
jgi:hypothetical protein